SLPANLVADCSSIDSNLAQLAQLGAVSSTNTGVLDALTVCSRLAVVTSVIVVGAEGFTRTEFRTTKAPTTTSTTARIPRIAFLFMDLSPFFRGVFARAELVRSTVQDASSPTLVTLVT